MIGTYCCAPTIAWVKDIDRTILIQTEEEQSWVIHGVEAVVWDLLTLDYSFQRIARFLSVLLDEPGEQARKRLLTIVQEWEKAGIVRAVRGHGCD